MFVVRAKNTTVFNAFQWLLQRNGVVNDGKTIFIGDKKQFVMASPHSLTESFADWFIKRWFAGEVDIPGMNRDTAACIQLGSCEFVFFGRVQ